jgi:hypothetical protein
MHLFGIPLTLCFPLVEQYHQHKIKYNLYELNYGGNMLDSNHCLIVKYLFCSIKKIFNQHMSKLHIYTRAILEHMTCLSIITIIVQVTINNYSNQIWPWNAIQSQIGSCIQLIFRYRAIVRFTL